jgi:hypothetical protein
VPADIASGPGLAVLSAGYMPRNQAIRPVMPESPISGFVRPDTMGCDGHFTRYEGDVVLADEEGRPLLVVKKLGEGYIVMSGTFHFPEKAFVDWACATGRKPVRL